MGPSCAYIEWLSRYPVLRLCRRRRAHDIRPALFRRQRHGRQPRRHFAYTKRFWNKSGPNEVSAAVVTTHLYGIPFRMGEINSLYNGGEPGISNAFESALSAIDTMFEYANVGVDGVNWHGGGGSAYTYFDIQAAQAEGASTFTLTAVNPLYYGLLFFQAATGNGARLLPVALEHPGQSKGFGHGLMLPAPHVWYCSIRTKS